MSGLIWGAILFGVTGAAMRRLFGAGSTFLFGVGTTGALLFAGAVAHLPLIPLILFIGVAAIAAIGLIPPLRREPSLRFPPIATAFTVVPLMLMLFGSLTLPLDDYDGRAFWVLKAKAIAHERSIDGPFFRGEEVRAPRNHYPLLLSIDDGALMILSRSLDDREIRWLYVAILAALAFELRRRLGMRFGPAAGGWLAALLVWIPQFQTAPGGALSAYSDIAIAAFSGCAMFEILERQSPIRLGFWLAFLILTKNEGLPFAVVLFIAGAFAFRGRIIRALPAPAIAALALFVWRSRIPSIDEDDYIRQLPHFLSRLDRLRPTLRALASDVVDVRQWGFFWIAVVLAAALLIVRGQGRTIAIPVAIIATMGCIYLGAYVASVWIVADLVHSSAPRLLEHLVPAGLWIIGACARSR